MGILSIVPVIGDVVDKGLDIVDKFVKDKDQAEELKAEIKQQIESQDHEQVMAELEGQLAINTEEAKHKSMFVAGWRPFIGWIGGMALGYQFLLYPILVWCWSFLQAQGIIPTELDAPPVLNTGALLTVVTGMLGIGGMRSFDKLKGVQTDYISEKKEKED